jgi:hypothetical protein
LQAFTSSLRFRTFFAISWTKCYLHPYSPPKWFLGCRPSLFQVFSDWQSVKVFRFFRIAASNSTNNINLYWKLPRCKQLGKNVQNIFRRSLFNRPIVFCKTLNLRCFHHQHLVVLSFNWI